MDFDMVFSDNSTGRNISIDSMSGFRSVKTIFKSLDPKECRFKLEMLFSGPLKNQLEELCKMAVDNGYRVLVLEDKEVLPLPLIFKYKGTEIKPLYTYYPKHVKSSIIRSILLDGSGDMKTRIDRAVYVLYHFWFYKCDNLSHTAHNVCIDLEEIISILINKGLSTYREYTITGELVEMLRDRLMSERLGNLDL